MNIPQNKRCQCGDDQIYIELDIRKIVVTDDGCHKISPRGEKCRISEIPKIIFINNQKYRLAGIVAYEPGHFTAYCWRSRGCWEHYNDVVKEKNIVRESTIIEPNGLIYIKFDNQT